MTQTEDFSLHTRGGPLACSLAAPTGLRAEAPALLLNFASTRASALGEDPYDIPARTFRAAGHYVLSFDIPNHGDRVDRHGAGIEGLCAATMAGDDPFARFVEDGRAVIDECLRRQIPGAAAVYVCGVSRTAYCALRLAAADRRVRGVAGLAPVTDWRPLREFTAARGAPQVAGLDLCHWARELAGRALYLAIGNADERVGTTPCIRLALAIFAEEARQALPTSAVELHVVSGAGHALSNEWRQAGAGYLLRRSL